LLKKNNDSLAHLGLEKTQDTSNLFIGTVYIKELSTYAHSVGNGQDPGSTDVNQREPQSRIDIRRAGFTSARVFKAFFVK
jgi:hypothetical protein